MSDTDVVTMPLSQHCFKLFTDIELIWIRQLELKLFRRLSYNVDSMPDFHNVSISLSKHCLNFLIKHWINIWIALLWHLLYNVVSMLAFHIVSIASMFLPDIEPLLISSRKWRCLDVFIIMLFQRLPLMLPQCQLINIMSTSFFTLEECRQTN